MQYRYDTTFHSYDQLIALFQWKKRRAELHTPLAARNSLNAGIVFLQRIKSFKAQGNTISLVLIF